MENNNWTLFAEVDDESLKKAGPQSSLGQIAFDQLSFADFKLFRNSRMFFSQHSVTGDVLVIKIENSINPNEAPLGTFIERDSGGWIYATQIWPLNEAKERANIAADILLAR